MRRLCVSSLALLAVATAAPAQTVPTTVRLTPQAFTNGVDHNCIRFTQVEPEKLLKDTRGLFAAVSVDFLECVIAEESSFGTYMGSSVTESDKHDRLIKEYGTLRMLRRWDRKIVDDYGNVKGTASTIEQTRYSTLESAFDSYESRVNSELTSHNLAQPFSGVLKLGAAFLERGGSTTPSGTTAAGDAGTANQGVVAHIDFESKHFGSDAGTAVEGSFGATLGFQPALTFLQPAAADANGQKNAAQQTTSYQNAFVFNVSGNAHLSTFRAGEVTLSGRVGVVNLLNDVTVVDNGSNSYIAVPFGHDTTSLYSEVSGHVNLYRTGMDVAHLEKATLTPLFHLEAGIRRDPRFEAAGPGYYKSSRRVFMRVSAENVPILQQLDNGTSKTFMLAFEWEYEAPWWGSPDAGDGTVKIPSGNRLVIRGDVNLLKALKGDTATKN
ncbi:MAG TPA: hypothetical protein VN628_19690 [Vicinamibacterales bacterium]|nr:hypothetical protein [Vicinamibacterales bacterium]